jgi:hypothetical protein
LNRHLDRVRYRPAERNLTIALEASPHGAAEETAPVARVVLEEDPSSVAYQRWSTAAHWAAALVPLLAVVLAAWLANSGFKRAPVLPLTPSLPTFGLLLERPVSLEQGSVILSKRSPELLSLFQAFNNGSRRLTIGQIPAAQSAAIYLPLRRPQHDSEYAALVDAGLGRLWLYVIHPPGDWSPIVLMDKSYKWAVKCHTSTAAISIWSSFRDQSGTRQSQCRPGGTCLVISTGCDGDTFSEFMVGAE